MRQLIQMGYTYILTPPSTYYIFSVIKEGSTCLYVYIDLVKV